VPCAPTGTVGTMEETGQHVSVPVLCKVPLPEFLCLDGAPRLCLKTCSATGIAAFTL